MSQLTPRQAQILALIQDRVQQHGLPPTRAEICTAFGFRSPNAAESHLRALAKKGVIELLAGASRGIRLIDGTTTNGLPLIGRVAAGSPILAEENIEAHHRLDAALFSPRADYLLTVHGTSMQGIGILDGDLLAVHRTPTAENGQVVVARLEDEVTVKRFHRQGHRVKLLAENPDFAPIVIDLRQQPLVIEGRAVGVVRSGIGL